MFCLAKIHILTEFPISALQFYTLFNISPSHITSQPVRREATRNRRVIRPLTKLSIKPILFAFIAVNVLS